MSYQLPAGFNPFPVGYKQHVPMKRGYYPPPPQYGQGGWGFGNPPQISEIFQDPKVIQYMKELNETSDSDSCSEEEDQVETFALEEDYSEGDDYEEDEGDDYDEEDDYEDEGDDYDEEDDYEDDYEEDDYEDRDDYEEEDDYEDDYEDEDDYEEDRDDYEDEDDYEEEDDYEDDDYEEREDFTNNDACSEPAVTKLLNHVPGSASAGATPVPVTGWSAAYTASGNKVKIAAYITTWCTGVGNVTYHLLRNGSIIDTGTFFFNQPAVHMNMPPLYAVIPNETGTNTYSISVQGTAGYKCNVDVNDKCLLVVTEY